MSNLDWRRLTRRDQRIALNQLAQLRDQKRESDDDEYESNIIDAAIDMLREVGHYVALRDTTINLASAMELKLRMHDESRGENGWRGEKLRWLLGRFDDEVTEMREAIDEARLDDVQGEIVDAANYLAFIFEAIDERVLATRAIAPRFGVDAMKPHPLERPDVPD